MPSKVLFVFEGAKTERAILKYLTRSFAGFDQEHIVATFNADIYQLYQKISDDEFLDIVEIIREKEKSNVEQLEGVIRSDISQVFLFFDYDGHATQSDDKKIKQMLMHFTDESEQGRLYISYPMVEALRHLHADVDFKSTSVRAKVDIKYKNVVGKSCAPMMNQMKKWELIKWSEVINTHCSKANFIVHGDYEFPNQLIGQEDIFLYQLKKYIEPDELVSVLSAFPVMVLDYYGVDKLKVMIRI